MTKKEEQILIFERKYLENMWSYIRKRGKESRLNRELEVVSKGEHSRTVKWIKGQRIS